MKKFLGGKLKLPFLTRRRHIELFVYPAVPELMDMRYIDATSKSKKTWMNRKVHADSSVSSCYGLIEMQKKSVTVQSWLDVIYKWDGNNWAYEITDRNLSFADIHPEQQTNGWGKKHGIDVLKVMPPYFAECSEDIDFILSASPFSHANFCIPSGLVSFKYTHDFNFFIYFHRDHPVENFVKAGDNLVNYTPMSDRPVKVHEIWSPEKINFFNRGTPLMFRDEFLRRRSRLIKVNNSK